MKNTTKINPTESRRQLPDDQLSATRLSGNPCRTSARDSFVSHACNSCWGASCSDTEITMETYPKPELLFTVYS